MKNINIKVYEWIQEYIGRKIIKLMIVSQYLI